MSEFAPICIYLVISPLVSLIPLGVPFLTYHLYLRKRKPEMTILSTVFTKLLCTNAHLGGRVAAHHFKVYICGSRNGIAIIDSDKTRICLRNALHFTGSLIRKKSRSFLLKTNHSFIYSIMEEMATNDSQWKIGAFLTNSDANPKKFRSRKNKINFGLNQQPDCVVILKADRKSSVILEADRSQIPILALVDSTIPWESYKRITYPIPANDPIQFVYLFRHSITKTARLEPTPVGNVSRSGGRHSCTSGGRRYYASASDPKGKKGSFLFRILSLCYHKIYFSILIPLMLYTNRIIFALSFSFLVLKLFLLLNLAFPLFAFAPEALVFASSYSGANAPATMKSHYILMFDDSDDLSRAVAPFIPRGGGAPVTPLLEERPLTMGEEERLALVLDYQNRIGALLKDLDATSPSPSPGKNHLSEESNGDLAASTLFHKDADLNDPDKLRNVHRGLLRSAHNSRYYSRAISWVSTERKVRAGKLPPLFFIDDDGEG